MLAGPTVNRVGETSWQDRDAAVRDFFEWMASAERYRDFAKLQAMLDQFTPAAIQQVVSRAGENSNGDARRARLSFLSLLFTICNRPSGASFLKLAVGASILPVCAAILREDAAAQVDYEQLLLLSLRLLSRVMNDLLGSHPLLSAGVLLPLAFRALSKVQGQSVAVTQARGYLELFSDTPQCAIDLRLIIPAPGAIRAMEADSHRSWAPLSHMVPIHRIGSGIRNQEAIYSGWRRVRSTTTGRIRCASSHLSSAAAISCASAAVGPACASWASGGASRGDEIDARVF
jgi:hypothetical protein